MQTALDAGTLTFTSQQLSSTYNVTNIGAGDYVQSKTTPTNYYVAQGGNVKVNSVFIGSQTAINEKISKGGINMCAPSQFDAPSENAEACANSFGNVCNWYWS